MECSNIPADGSVAAEKASCPPDFLDLSGNIGHGKNTTQTLIFTEYQIVGGSALPASQFKRVQPLA